MTIPTPPAVNTVDKFGVSVTGSQGQGPIMQPRQKYRFRVLFLGFGGTGNAAAPISLNTNTCGLPTIEHQEVEVNSYNNKAYYAGKFSWSPIEIVVRDSVDMTVQQNIGAQLQLQLDHYNQTGFRAGQDYKFTTQIQYLDGGYDSAGPAWTLEGCWLQRVSYGELDYSASETVTITMSLRFDNAIIESGAGTNSILSNPPVDPLSNFLD